MIHTIRTALLSLALCCVSLSAQTWQPESPIPTVGSRGQAAAVKIGTTIFLTGGTPLNVDGDAPVHKLVGTTWSTTTPLEGSFLHHGAAMDSLGRLIIFAGLDAGGDRGDGYEWTEADGNNGGIDSRSGSAPDSRFAVATDSMGRIYSVGGGGGANTGGGNSNSTRVERYEASTDIWSVLAPLPVAVADACAAYDGAGYIFVFGGYDSLGQRTANVSRYDIVANTWSDTIVPDMPMARSGASAVLGADGRIYVIGGSDGAPTNTTFILNLNTLTWSTGPNLAIAREHFGCILRDSGDIFVMGGSTTNTVESLFTPTCPTFTKQPGHAQGFLGASIGFDVAVSGTAPFTYQWYRDGIALIDGPTGTGSIIVGATTAGVGVQTPGVSDLGTFHCVVSNACGSTQSISETATLSLPTQIPATFVVSNLHPAGSLSSAANSVDGGIIGGSAKYTHPTYGQLSHPIKWDASGGVGVDITPANSVGGEILDVKNGVLSGWWWWPYTVIQGTGYYRHASVWENNGTTHVDVQRSGWEIGTVFASDGQHHVGNCVSSDDYPSQSGAFYWAVSNHSPYRIDPIGHSSTVVQAIENGWEYGTSGSGFNSLHASKWMGATKDFVDMNPPTASKSSISGAGDGQQVGSATINAIAQGGYWSDSAGSFVSLVPAIGGNVTVNDAEAGLQVGVLDGAATIWNGTRESAFDLHQYVPSNFTVSIAQGVDLAADGTVTVVGFGFNGTTGRWEALKWQGALPLLTQDTTTVSAMAGAIFHQYVNGDPAWAGQVYAIVGSASGSVPGVMIGNAQLLPLNPDFYLDYMINTPNDWIYPSFAYLDGSGRALATATLPAGALYVAGQVTLHHAVVILTADGTGFEAISDAVPLTITP